MKPTKEAIRELTGRVIDAARFCHKGHGEGAFCEEFGCGAVIAAYDEGRADAAWTAATCDEGPAAGDATSTDPPRAGLGPVRERIAQLHEWLDEQEKRIAAIEARLGEGVNSE